MKNFYLCWLFLMLTRHSAGVDDDRTNNTENAEDQLHESTAKDTETGGIRNQSFRAADGEEKEIDSSLSIKSIDTKAKEVSGSQPSLVTKIPQKDEDDYSLSASIRDAVEEINDIRLSTTREELETGASAPENERDTTSTVSSTSVALHGDDKFFNVNLQAEEQTNSLVEKEKLCISTHNAEYAEILLNSRMKMVNRIGENWWKTIGLFFRTGAGVNISRPMCSKYPHLPLKSKKKISDHAFFVSRNIDIPIRFGRTGNRWIEFRYVDRPATWNILLECDCRVMDAGNTSTGTSEDNICMKGKLVNLSRGVGGDSSFFVYATNPLNGNFNVVAHICI